MRAIYADYAGWFDGHPTKLFPLPERDRAARVIELAGGREQVLSRARRASADKDFQWAAELTDYVLAIDSGECPPGSRTPPPPDLGYRTAPPRR